MNVAIAISACFAIIVIASLLYAYFLARMDRAADDARRPLTPHEIMERQRVQFARIASNGWLDEGERRLAQARLVEIDQQLVTIAIHHEQQQLEKLKRIRP